MRKFILSAALTSTALTLTACADTNEPADDVAVAEPEVGDTEMTEVGDADVIDANDANAIQLAGIDSIPSDVAQAVVAGQPYNSITDLNAVLMETMSEEEAAAVRERLFVPVDLNTATREQIALIPGMTDRMIREFMEYQPYEDMAEFDREIGKYVDEDEVARFRRYVTL